MPSEHSRRCFTDRIPGTVGQGNEPVPLAQGIPIEQNSISPSGWPDKSQANQIPKETLARISRFNGFSLERTS
jgi:hypothetical protein